MTILNKVARAFQISPHSLLRESLRIYLKQKLIQVESEMFILAKKYGVQNVFELDARVQQGLFHEQDTSENYFRMDYLESEQDKIKHLLDTL